MAAEKLDTTVSPHRFYINESATHLSKRELECLNWIAKGKTAEMVAMILNISPRTIKAHVENIKRKLGCFNYFQLGMAYEKILQNTSK